MRCVVQTTANFVLTALNTHTIQKKNRYFVHHATKIPVLDDVIARSFTTCFYQTKPVVLFEMRVPEELNLLYFFPISAMAAKQ